MNLYFEKNVINENMRDNPAKGKTFETLRIIVTAIMIVVLTFLLWYVQWTDANWLFNVALFSIVLGPSITLILVFGRLLKKHCCEYDYIISNNELKIIRIYNYKKRETILTLDLSNALRIGFTSEDDFKQCEEKSEKKVAGFCNINEDYLYVFGTIKGINTLLICEFDADFITALKKSVASYGVFSEEFKKYKG